MKTVKDLQVDLQSNIEFVQDKIDFIKNKEVIDIKDISDMQRFADIMKNFMSCLNFTRETR